MDNKELDVVSLFSLYLTILNLIENREQSEHNDISSANDKQARYILNRISEKFDEQNEMLKKILSTLEDNNERNR